MDIKYSLVSIIIPNWNSKLFISKCLSSVRSQTYKNYELIIIDNNSADNSVELIREEIKDINANIIRNPSNLGFSRAMNQGIRASKGEFVLALNTDVILEPDYIKEILNVMSDARIGSATGKLYRFPDDYGGKKVLDSTGHILLADESVINRGDSDEDTDRYDNDGEIFGVCAAAALYRRGMLEDIKLGEEYFDEQFYVGFEDVDLDWRALLRGWKARYIPAAVGYHKRGGTNWLLNRKMMTNSRRNKMLLVAKNDFALNYLMNFPIVMAYTLENLLYGFYKKIDVYLISLMNFIIALPWVLSKRSKIRSGRKISFKEFRKYVHVDRGDRQMAWHLAVVLIILGILSKIFTFKVVALTIILIAVVINPAINYMTKKFKSLTGRI